jgi:hypothetical protein
MHAMMGAISLKTISYVRRRKREFPRIRLCLDEANNARLVGESGYEVRALAELRKYGFGGTILVQLLDFPSTRIERAVLANCATRHYFCCSDPKTAARLGEDLGGTYVTEGTKTRYYKDGSTFDAPATFDNPYARELRKLPRGVCFTRQGTTVKREHITPLPAPFGLSKMALSNLTSGLLRVVQQRPEYYTPASGETPATSQSPPLSDSKPESDDGPFAI